MPNPSFPFDPLLADRVLSYIRSGGYPLVAAQAAGVPREVFRQWVEWGEKKSAREPYRGFAAGVRQAVAHARLMAELAVHDKDPKYWLSHGPGREAPDNPGWTGEVKPISDREQEPTLVSASAEWNTLYAAVLRALAEFPEARQAVALVLKETGSWDSTRKPTARN